MKKKLIAIFAVAALGCCAFTGCETDSSDESSQESTAAEGSSVTTETESESEEEETTEESSDAEPEEINEVLYEDNTVRITYTGLDTEDWLGDGLKVTVENLSDKNITVQTREASVNGVMEDPYFSCDVAAGKTANDSITFSIDAEIGVVELSFHVYDSDTWDTIVDTDTITVTVNEDVEVEKVDATVVYETDSVVVSYAGIEEDDIWGTEFNFVIENNGDETYTVAADNVSIDGVMYDGTLYTEVTAGKYANDSMYFIGEELPEEMNELEFTIRITDSNYQTVAESDPITIMIG